MALAPASNIAPLSNIVPLSHIALVRARCRLEEAFSSQQWPQVTELDKQLVIVLSTAVNDPYRNMENLVGELQKITHLYGQLVKSCQTNANRLASKDNSMLF